MYTLSVSCPQSARRPYVASSPLPSTWACPKKIQSTPRKLQRKERRKVAAIFHSSSVEAMKEGVEDLQLWRPAPRLLASAPLPFSRSSPVTPHSARLPRLGLGGEEVQDRLAAPCIGEEAPDFKPVLPPLDLPTSLRASAHRIFCRAFRSEQFLKM